MKRYLSTSGVQTLTGAVLVAAILGGCQIGTPRPAPADVSPGTKLVLTRDLAVPTGVSSVFMQNGAVMPRGDIDRKRPHCELRMNRQAKADAPIVVRADTFVVESIRRRRVGDSATVRFASNGLFAFDRAVFAELVTQMTLRSDVQPIVRYLRCEYWGDPVAGRHLSMEQLRDALGDLITIEKAPAS